MKAEQFIKDCTKGYSNELCYEEGLGNLYEHWLTPEQALRAVEIAREEIIEWLYKNKNHPFIECEDPCLSGYLTDKFIEELRKEVKSL